MHRAGSPATSSRSRPVQSFEPPARPPPEQMEQTMSLCVSCSETQPRSVLSFVTTTAAAGIPAMTFAAGGPAPTALYHQYQDSFGLTSFAITVIFPAYVLSLVAALLTVS